MKNLVWLNGEVRAKTHVQTQRFKRKRPIRIHIKQNKIQEIPESLFSLNIQNPLLKRWINIFTLLSKVS